MLRAENAVSVVAGGVEEADFDPYLRTFGHRLQVVQFAWLFDPSKILLLVVVKTSEPRIPLGSHFRPPYTGTSSSTDMLRALATVVPLARHGAPGASSFKNPRSEDFHAAARLCGGTFSKVPGLGVLGGTSRGRGFAASKKSQRLSPQTTGPNESILVANASHQQRSLALRQEPFPGRVPQCVCDGGFECEERDPGDGGEEGLKRDANIMSPLLNDGPGPVDSRATLPCLP
ncbi:hypothetical protein BDK51DRAFT_45076 [Blyttiomyces helicus]|uniref:Uncharacterized protein n=1 Tax=Blyttiomyces helicus TaxID=388810 RepID=A0A4P9WH42_9FUNG|nr:hypothetical protein BDK51DRAFT_45076 [Blyttiomyces helicus]|eukprot:RKO92044.1 hypothetical protein BDK51DRAFT_45076 [Blyttiomyces helicus]